MQGVDRKVGDPERGETLSGIRLRVSHKTAESRGMRTMATRSIGSRSPAACRPRATAKCEVSKKVSPCSRRQGAQGNGYLRRSIRGTGVARQVGRADVTTAWPRAHDDGG